jgi:hypothetical protein
LSPQILTGSFVLITKERIKITDAVEALYLEKKVAKKDTSYLFYVSLIDDASKTHDDLIEKTVLSTNYWSRYL